MAICRQKRGDKVYLYRYKNVREGKKVRHVFIEYLGVEGKDGKPVKSPKRILDRVDISSVRKYGAVCVLWRLCEQMGLEGIMNSVVQKRGFSAGRLLVLLAINWCIQPKSFTGFSRWYAKTELPELAGLPPAALSKDNLLSAMDAVCGENEEGEYDFTLEIEKEIFDACRKTLPEGTFSTLLYDLTNAFFHGGTCVLAEFGYTPKGTKKKKVHVALVVTRRYHIPIFHMVLRGSVQGALTAGKLLDIMDNFGIKKVTLVWYRGVTSAENVGWADTQRIGLICGLRRDLVEIRKMIHECEVPETPSTLVRGYGDGGIYAIGKETTVFGKKRKVVIYLNTTKRDSKRISRNEKIKRANSELAGISGRWSDQEKVHKRVDAILKGISDYVKVSYRVKDGSVFVDHRIDEEALNLAARSDGKYALMSTDLSMGVEDVVNAYFAKSEIERTFRTMKQVIGLEPIRHRLEFRVKAHMFVCFMAYLLYSMLGYKLKNAGILESVEEVLERLNDVEKIRLTYGKQTDERYLNLGKFEWDVLTKLEMRDMCQTKSIERGQV
jgi:transposase